MTVSAFQGGGNEHLRLLVLNLAVHGVCSYIAVPCGYPFWTKFAACAGTERMQPMPERRFRLGALLRLVLFARRNGVDLLHSHGKGAGLYARLAGFLTGIPCVHTYHGIHRGFMGQAAWRCYCLLERALGYVTRAAISVSPGEREQILSLGFCPSDRLRLIPNGIQCRPRPHGEGMPPHLRRDIVHVTRFDPYQKNSESVVLVAESLKRAGNLGRFRFVMLGEGPGRRAVEALAREKGLAEIFHFAGLVESSRPYLRDAFCILSTSRWEGLPLALLEAMDEGLPVVASRVVGNRDAVQDGRTGFLYELDNPGHAAQAITDLDQDPELWRRFAAAGMELVARNHRAGDMARLTVEAYRAAVKS